MYTWLLRIGHFPFICQKYILLRCQSSYELMRNSYTANTKANFAEALVETYEFSALIMYALVHVIGFHTTTIFISVYSFLTLFKLLTELRNPPDSHRFHSCQECYCIPLPKINSIQSCVIVRVVAE